MLYCLIILFNCGIVYWLNIIYILLSCYSIEKKASARDAVVSCRAGGALAHPTNWLQRKKNCNVSISDHLFEDWERVLNSIFYYFLLWRFQKIENRKPSQLKMENPCRRSVFSYICCIRANIWISIWSYATSTDWNRKRLWCICLWFLLWMRSRSNCRCQFRL